MVAQPIDQTTTAHEKHRYVKIVNDEEEKPIKIKKCETSVSFREVKYQFAQGLAEEIITSLEEKNLN